MTTAVAIGGLSVPAILTPPTFGKAALATLELWHAVVVAGGQVFQITETGSIKGASFGIAANMWTTPAAIDVRLETVGSDGRPTGTLWATNTNYSITSGIAANTWQSVDFTAPASVTRGDFVALVIQPSTTYDFYLKINNGGPLRFPYGTAKVSGAWNKDTYTLQCGLKYADDAYRHFPGVSTWSVIDNTDFNTGNTPDEIGIKFVAPFDCTVGGVWSTAELASASAITFKLYDGATTVFTFSVGGAMSNNAPPGLNQHILPASYSLTAGATYRLTAQSSSVSSMRLTKGTVSAAALMAANHMGADCVWTERTDGGSWTDISTQRPFMGLLLDGVPAGGGGGGSVASPQVYLLG